MQETLLEIQHAPCRSARPTSQRYLKVENSNNWDRAGYLAGEYMNHSTGAGGPADMVKADGPVASADIVLWHVFDLRHVPRPEDFPVQPSIIRGFKLMPARFLT